MKYEEILCDANVLYEAYLHSVKSSKWKESTQRFMMNFLRYIFEIQEEMKSRTLQNLPTREFILSERGHLRPVTSLQVKDRIVRHALCDEILLPEVRKHIIYDNCASLKGRGIGQQRKRLEIHLHKYYELYGTDGYILFGDFSKFYDNVVHRVAKQELLRLFPDDDGFLNWLLDLIFDGFKIDVSYMNDEEYAGCMDALFNKIEYRKLPKSLRTGEKIMAKSIEIGDQLSQVIGIYYPYPIDNYVKTVRGQKFYGRYTDDWYVMNPSKEELLDILAHIKELAGMLGIHINEKKLRIVKVTEPFTFLQVRYRLMPDGTIRKRLASKKVTGMRRKLHKLAVKVQTGERTYDEVERMFRSWMGSFYKLLTRKQRKAMIALYEQLFDKRITVEKKKLVIKDREEKEADFL